VVYLNLEEKSLPSLKTWEPMHETDFSFDKRNKNLEINKVHSLIEIGQNVIILFATSL
jgi:hypothetical protein